MILYFISFRIFVNPFFHIEYHPEKQKSMVFPQNIGLNPEIIPKTTQIFTNL